jgi:2-C-methyl-D-erythritol 4-phosphate cytidylyltransferase
VLAAGQGTRVGGGMNKVFLPLRGKPIVVHALELFQASPTVDWVVLVVAEADLAYCRREILGCFPLPKVRELVVGGSTRAESEYKALQALRTAIEAGRVGFVLVHDAARPLARPELVEAVVEGARESGACIPALPSKDVVLRVASAGRVAEVYPPESVWAAQTPQAFEAGLLLSSYDRAWQAGFASTDTASAVEWAGHRVRIVAGDERNLKVTTPDDLRYAEILLGRRHADL